MKQFDVKCPHCGKVNKDLYLEETDGWMECEECGKVSKGMEFESFLTQKVPVLSMKQASDLYSRQHA